MLSNLAERLRIRCQLTNEPWKWVNNNFFKVIVFIVKLSIHDRLLVWLLGILLSEQTKHFRMNMYEMLARNPHDQIGLEVLMEMGLGYDDAVLFLFENRVVFYTAVTGAHPAAIS